MNRLLLCLQDLSGCFPADVPDLTLQLPDSGFLCIVAGHLPQRVPAYGQLIRRKAVPLQLLWYQMLDGNMHLLILRIAADFNDFHPVQKRTRDGLKRVCRGDKKHFGQVHRNFQIMVPELAVLLAVQHFQQCGEGISFIIIAHLVNLIQQHQRILNTRMLQRAGNSSWHGPYIGLPVSPDLRLVPHASQGNTHIRLFQRPGQRLGDGSLASTRRPDQAQDRGISLFRQRPDCQKFQHPFLDFLQAIVILVQYLLGIGDILVISAYFIPGHFQHGLDVSADHSHFRRAVHGILKPLDLLAKLLLDFLGSL